MSEMFDEITMRLDHEKKYAGSLVPQILFPLKYIEWMYDKLKLTEQTIYCNCCNDGIHKGKIGECLCGKCSYCLAKKEK